MMNSEIISMIKDRLEKGKRQYGDQINIYDGRDWIQETLEEVLDGLVYLTNYLLRLDEMKIETGFKSEEDKINEKL